MFFSKCSNYGFFLLNAWYFDSTQFQPNERFLLELKITKDARISVKNWFKTNFSFFVLFCFMYDLKFRRRRGRRQKKTKRQRSMMIKCGFRLNFAQVKIIVIIEHSFFGVVLTAYCFLLINPLSVLCMHSMWMTHWKSPDTLTHTHGVTSILQYRVVNCPKCVFVKMCVRVCV